MKDPSIFDHGAYREALALGATTSQAMLIAWRFAESGEKLARNAVEAGYRSNLREPAPLVKKRAAGA